MDTLNLSELVGNIVLHSEVEETLHTLCDRLGVRWPGTPGEAQAADYLAAKFEEYGLKNVAKERFTLSTWVRGRASLDMVAPFARSMDILELPNTGAHSVRGEAVFVSFETLDEWQVLAPSVRGRIVVCQGGARRGVGPRISRGEKARLAQEAGAVAFLWVAERKGKVALTGSVDRAVGDVMPCATVVREDAAVLRRAHERYGVVELAVRTEGSRQHVPAYNVVGEIPGTEASDALVLGGAHYDGHDISDGAHDNGSGVAAMLEAARALSSFAGRLRSTVRFIMFTAEEIGVIGSGVYAQRHEDELDRVRFMLNVDGVGRSPDFQYLHLPLGGPTVDWLHRFLVEKHRRPVLVERSSMPLFWDHEAFALAGVPCASLTDPVGAGSWAHTVADGLDKLSYESVNRAAVHLALILTAAAQAEDWPARRKGPAAVERMLQEAGVAPATAAARNRALRDLVVTDEDADGGGA